MRMGRGAEERKRGWGLWGQVKWETEGVKKREGLEERKGRGREEREREEGA